MWNFFPRPNLDSQCWCQSSQSCPLCKKNPLQRGVMCLILEPNTSLKCVSRNIWSERHSLCSNRLWSDTSTVLHSSSICDRLSSGITSCGCCWVKALLSEQCIFFGVICLPAKQLQSSLFTALNMKCTFYTDYKVRCKKLLRVLLLLYGDIKAIVVFTHIVSGHLKYSTGCSESWLCTVKII